MIDQTWSRNQNTECVFWTNSFIAVGEAETIKEKPHWRPIHAKLSPERAKGMLGKKMIS